jgi:hypothetical protein
MKPLLRFYCSLLVLPLSLRATDGTNARPATPLLPLIHCTDLFHPHGDPDDHFDLATLYGIPGLDLKAIILDQGRLQVKQPGTIPVSQLNHITGRKVTAAIGLAEKLRSPTDTGLDQPAEFQKGVALILSTLRQSPVPVAITAVGSMRDVVAAFNREPDLFRRKVDKLLIFIGEASDAKFTEWNVSLDPQAYVGLMRSGLPLYWAPCFDGGLWQNRGHASFWQARHADLLRNARPALLQFFIYALEKETADPITFLSTPVDPQRKERLLAGTRNLWCAAVFEFLVAPEKTGMMFGFSEVEARVGDDAVIRYGHAPSSKRVRRFEVRDLTTYPTQMTTATSALLARVGAH